MSSLLSVTTAGTNKVQGDEGEEVFPSRLNSDMCASRGELSLEMEKDLMYVGFMLCFMYF